MRALRFEASSDFPVASAALWAFHLRPEALEVLAPPLAGFEVREPGSGVAEGSVLTMIVGRGPFRARWVALHCGVEPGREFHDVALESPFPYWVHRHRVSPLGPAASRLTDTVWFVPPRWLPRAVGATLTRVALRLLFAWRHRATRRWLSAHAEPHRVSARSTALVAAGGRS
jgi:ligand-binding SRPBCC domain-containing protein